MDAKSEDAVPSLTKTADVAAVEFESAKRRETRTKQADVEARLCSALVYREDDEAAELDRKKRTYDDRLKRPLNGGGLARTLARLDVSDCASMFCVDFAAGLSALEVLEARGLGIAALPAPRDRASRDSDSAANARHRSKAAANARHDSTAALLRRRARRGARRGAGGRSAAAAAAGRGARGRGHGRTDPRRPLPH